MNVNVVMDRLINDLGLADLGLHDFYPDILDNIRKKTIPDFSQFFPHHYRFTMGLNERLSLDDGNGTSVYKLSDPFLDIANPTILGIVDVEGMSLYTDYNTPPPMFDVHDVILGAAATNIASLGNISSRDWKFVPPRSVRLKGYFKIDLTCTVKIPHPNFGTISDSISLSFMELAVIDTQLLLYQKLKHYDGLETMDGSIELKIDEWSDAMSRREEKIREFRTDGFPNSAGYRQYFE